MDDETDWARYKRLPPDERDRLGFRMHQWNTRIGHRGEDAMKGDAIIFIGIPIALVFGLLFFIVEATSIAEARCADKGGVEVRTPNGTICAKLEVIAP